MKERGIWCSLMILVW